MHCLVVSVRFIRPRQQDSQLAQTDLDEIDVEMQQFSVLDCLQTQRQNFVHKSCAIEIVGHIMDLHYFNTSPFVAEAVHIRLLSTCSECVPRVSLAGLESGCSGGSTD